MAQRPHLLAEHALVFRGSMTPRGRRLTTTPSDSTTIGTRAESGSQLVERRASPCEKPIRSRRRALRSRQSGRSCGKCVVGFPDRSLNTNPSAEMCRRVEDSTIREGVSIVRRDVQQATTQPAKVREELSLKERLWRVRARTRRFGGSSRRRHHSCLRDSRMSAMIGGETIGRPTDLHPKRV